MRVMRRELRIMNRRVVKGEAVDHFQNYFELEMLRLTGFTSKNNNIHRKNGEHLPSILYTPRQETALSNPKHTTAPAVAIKQPSSLPHYGTNNPAPPALKLKWDSYPLQGSP